MGEVTGLWNYDFTVYANSYWDFWLFWKGFYSKFGTAIRKFRINPYTELTYYPRTFLVAPERHASEGKKIFDAKRQVRLSEGEMRLLYDISLRGRDSVSEISRRTGLSFAFVSKAMPEMQRQGVILGFRAMIDRQFLGMDYYKADVMVSSPAKVKALSSFAARHPFVIYEDMAIGGSSFEFDFLARNSDHAKEILGAVQDVCGSSLDHLEYFQVLNELKLAHLSKNIFAGAQE
jgi:DNA-binding Lrp family transcriptional regulator